jgi:hypothetical protein
MTPYEILGISRRDRLNGHRAWKPKRRHRDPLLGDLILALTRESQG